MSASFSGASNVRGRSAAGAGPASGASLGSGSSQGQSLSHSSNPYLAGTVPLAEALQQMRLGSSDFSYSYGGAVSPEKASSSSSYFNTSGAVPAGAPRRLQMGE